MVGMFRTLIGVVFTAHMTWAVVCTMRMPICYKLPIFVSGKRRRLIANVPIATETERINRSMVHMIAKERSVPLFPQGPKSATRSCIFPK